MVIWGDYYCFTHIKQFFRITQCGSWGMTCHWLTSLAGDARRQMPGVESVADLGSTAEATCTTWGSVGTLGTEAFCKVRYTDLVRSQNSPSHGVNFSGAFHNWIDLNRGCYSMQLSRILWDPAIICIPAPDKVRGRDFSHGGVEHMSPAS